VSPRSRHRALIFLFSTLLLAACHGGSTTRPAGGLCSDESDCDEGLPCRYGRCRQLCDSNDDCPEGICISVVGEPDLWVCTTSPESGCGATGCPDTLVCASDGNCRTPCGESMPCSGGRVCVDGVCVDDLPPPDGDADSPGDLRGEDGGCSCRSAGARPYASRIARLLAVVTTSDLTWP
jgi:hypothetical protein